MILRHASSCPIFPVNSAKVTHLAEHVYFKSTAYLAVWTLTFSFHLSWPLPGQSSGMLVPWILSAVDVGPGGCFQARSILNAFAKTRGAPWLSESGWDTAHFHFLLANGHKSWAARAVASIYLAFPANPSKVNGARVWTAGPSWKISQWE